MKILSLSEAKMKLSALVEALQIDEEEVVITKNGRPAAVLVSPSEYERWQETLRVLSDAELMAEIKQGLEALREQKVPLYTLEELFEETPQDGC
jgi:prevent-host-death family protein